VPSVPRVYSGNKAIPSNGCGTRGGRGLSIPYSCVATSLCAILLRGWLVLTARAPSADCGRLRAADPVSIPAAPPMTTTRGNDYAAACSASRLAHDRYSTASTN
jgi:hypothetical protein